MKEFLHAALFCCGLALGLSAPAALADDPPAIPTPTDAPSDGAWSNKKPATAPVPTDAAGSNAWSNKKAAAAPAPDTVRSDGPTAGQQLLLQAMGLIGVRYKWGGNNPEDGLDCSGFVRYVFQNSLNIALPHNAMGMSRLGENVDRSELKPGDLVFFNTLGRTFSHVGIYMGDNRFIHSPRAGKSVETANLNETYWQKRWNGARRVADAGGQGINLAGLLAVAGNPEAVKVEDTASGAHCKKVVQGHGKKKKVVMVCQRAKGSAKTESSKPAGKSAKGGKSSAKSSGKAAKPASGGKKHHKK
ncbi:Cell wall-associated hydrolase, NlpC family [Andreprevotia lacus DSM 23236]|jgi:cell wall-associated NlpC family hydrolase|uniref:Cell wall-associated hydrolase, NlpC family n=1 Tax=Andreprevotia lacus DSM 23236 TaxID=1121001 RepID=A0A1W1XEG9_9NEIS|nr:Cell wall-associated hydrolase, NlpC family [Andreprevotia lacus DSM 23236]